MNFNRYVVKGSPPESIGRHELVSAGTLHKSKTGSISRMAFLDDAISGDPGDMRSRRTVVSESGKAVLVVIPVFNRCKMIVDALDSVCGQTHRPVEVIVVDDGSTDATAAVAQAWIEKHPNLDVTLIKIANQGASAARNIGFFAHRQAVDFVAFLDSDDVWPSDFLERSVSRLADNPAAIVAVSDRAFVKVGGDKAKVVSSRNFVADPFLAIIRAGAGYGSAALIRARAFEETGGYPEDVPTGHDIILFEKLAAMGECLYAPGQPVTMRIWYSVPNLGQEPHLHLRYPDRYIRWAETYLAVCQSRLNRSNIDVGQELRYHLAVAYRFLLALALEIGRVRPSQVIRILRNLAQLTVVVNKALFKGLSSKYSAK